MRRPTGTGGLLPRAKLDKHGGKYPDGTDIIVHRDFIECHGGDREYIYFGDMPLSVIRYVLMNYYHPHFRVMHGDAGAGFTYYLKKMYDDLEWTYERSEQSFDPGVNDIRGEWG